MYIFLKPLILFVTLFTIFFSFTSTINAQLRGDFNSEGVCEINGEIVPCDEFFERAGPFFIIFTTISIIVGLVAFAFWLWMLIDAVSNQEEDKVIWILVILFVNTLGAIIYYFAARGPRIKNNSISEQKVSGPITNN